MNTHTTITVTALAAFAALTVPADARTPHVQTCGPQVASPDGATTQTCQTPLNPADINCNQAPDQAVNQTTGERVITLTICPDPAAATLRRQLIRERAIWRGQRLRLVIENRRLNAKLAAHHAPSVTEAITIASLVSGVPRAHLTRVVHCESGGRPWAVNTTSGASGLVQYLPSTWAATTFGRAGLNRFSPYANVIQGALAMRHSMRPWAASRHCWGTQ